ncbi:MAG: signal peptide peptidase SppA [Candidatus Eisenbacteria bacterium]|nr:signal peptide peptidase SppA [Candidatus Eisenbacteria bacterium]
MRPLAAAATLALLALAAARADATAPTPNLPLALYGDEGVATTDDARAALFNPAGLGVRYPAELFVGFSHAGPKQEWNTTLLSAGGFGFIALRQRDTTQTYGLAFAAGGEKLRAGWAPYWVVTGKAIGRATTPDHRFGLLSRPSPWLSAGAVVEHVLRPKFRGDRLAREYTLGVGLRPLALNRARAHDLGTRLTLGADVTLVEDGDWSQARSRVTAELEPVPGLALAASVADHRELRVGLTLRGVGGSLHGGTARAGDRRLYDHWAVSLHAGEEPSVFAAKSERRVAVVRAGGLLADEALGGGLLGGASTVAGAPLHAQLRRALEDPLVRGVLLDLRGVAGMAQLEELRPRVQALRLAGKPVVAFLETGGGRGDLYLASACDRVFTTEEADFTGLGLRVERRYYREFLAGLGLRMDRVSVGDYKSAFRNFSVDSTGAADTESIERTLDVSQALFTEALAQGRGVPRERFAHVLDGRAWPAADLVAAGLVDSVGWREDALRALGRLAGLGPKPRTVNLRRAPLAGREWTRRSPVAVVYAGGAIETGRSGGSLLTGPYMGSETIIAQLERAFRAPGVRAVVLRIESPGGSAIASNLMDHAVTRLKRETGKPCIVSMGSVAASGGYYIAAHGDRIFADRATRTGSIGVLFVKPSLEGFYAKHGIRQDDFERGAYMAGGSPARDWTPAFQASADSAIRRHYDLFVARVAQGRGLDPADVYRAAQGRVWLGDDARERRLVDEIGGFEAALAEARRRAGVPPGEKIRLFELHRPRGGFLERLVRGWVTETLERDASLRSLRGAQLRDAEWLEGLEE